MVSLNSIDLKVSKIKKSLENGTSNNLLMFISESEDLSYVEISIQYNGKTEIINCYSVKEYEKILDKFSNYNKQIFFDVRRPKEDTYFVSV